MTRANVECSDGNRERLINVKNRPIRTVNEHSFDDLIKMVENLSKYTEHFMVKENKELKKEIASLQQKKKQTGNKKIKAYVFAVLT